MTTPISFTVRPPSAIPARPSPLGNGSRANSRAGPPSRRLFDSQAEGEDDEDDEDNNDGSSRHRDGGSRAIEERIEGFDRRGKAIGYVWIILPDRADTNSGEQPSGPLVIPSLPNRDWRQSSSRRTPSYRPETRGQVDPNDTHERIGDEPQKSGLRYIKREEQVKVENGFGQEGGVRVKVEEGMESVATTNGTTMSTTTTSTTSTTTTSTSFIKPDPDAPPPPPLTLEQQALQAILAGETTESKVAKAQAEMVIRLEETRRNPWSEEDALQRDLTELPEVSTEDDYRAVPIEAFGAAMLRGMGWDPKSEENTKVHVPKPRPGQLGLGATPMNEIVPPSHGKASKGKKKEEYAKRSGRGFNASGVMVKREIGNGNGTGSENGGSGAVTPNGNGSGASRRTSPEYDSDASRRRRRDDEDGETGSGRESKRREYDRDRDRDRSQRYRDSAREKETEEERARRKARERERERDRDSDTGDRDRRRDDNGDRTRDRYDDRDRDRDRSRYDDRDRRDRDRDRDRERRKDRDY